MTPKMKPFKGFSYPTSNYFLCPNEWTDAVAVMSTAAEIRVVNYVLRHTWGYGEYTEFKKITLDEFCNGRKRKDGSRMDNGCGMRLQAIRQGINKAVAHGFLEVQKDDKDQARIKKYYRIRMIPKSPSRLVKITPLSGENHPSDGGQSPIDQRNTLSRNTLEGDSSTAYHEDFQNWYARYPRRQAKRKAAEAFENAVVHLIEEGISSREEAVKILIDGADKYAVAKKEEDPQYIRLPTTWLNQGCWDDEYPEKNNSNGKPTNNCWWDIPHLKLAGWQAEKIVDRVKSVQLKIMEKYKSQNNGIPLKAAAVNAFAVKMGYPGYEDKYWPCLEKFQGKLFEEK